MPAVSVKSIKIGERIREDMGDIQGLAESISKRGLLHPIIIDELGNLIAGHRRLEAVKLLGWDIVETRTISDLTEKEKRLIELEENTKRKDLTEYEKSKNLVELAEATKESMKDELMSPEVTKTSEKGGRPEIPNSDSKVAERIGTTRKSISEAKHHVQAVGKYPELESSPKKEAIKTAKLYDASIPLQSGVTESEEQKKMARQRRHEEKMRQMTLSFLYHLPSEPLDTYDEDLLGYWLEHIYGDKQLTVESTLAAFIHARRVFDKVEKILQKFKGPRRVV